MEISCKLMKKSQESFEIWSVKMSGKGCLLVGGGNDRKIDALFCSYCMNSMAPCDAHSHGLCRW